MLRMRAHDRGDSIDLSGSHDPSYLKYLTGGK
jgi:hypothetical protein